MRIVHRSIPTVCLRWLMAALLWAAMGIAGAAAPSPQRYALLVGVSGYKAPIDPLPGAKNDVTLLANTLLELGYARANMRIVADDLSNAYYSPKLKADDLPTRAAILDGLDWLASRAQRGDHVTIFFSGHGSYLPELKKAGGDTEPDGLDEIFLPIDIKGMGDGAVEVVNAVRDDDLAIKIQRIQAHGADVWLVADACHAGTLSRGSFRVRGVDPVRQLGVPQQRIIDAARARPPAQASSPLQFPGQRFVGFYAALPSMRTIEVDVPMEARSNERRPHGLLTWYLVQALRSAQSASYGDLARFVMAGYTQWGADAPIPLFEGDIDSRPPFTTAATRLYSLSATGQQVHLEAGFLDDLDKDSSLRIVDLRTQGSAAVASAVIVKAGAERSMLDIQADKTLLTKIVQTPDAYGARVERRTLPYRLRLALPEQPNASMTAADRAVSERAGKHAKALLALPPEQRRAPYEQVTAGETPDVRLVVRNARLWFAPPGGDFPTSGGSQPFSLATDQISTDSINTALGVIARGRNLLRVANSLASTPVAHALRVQLATIPRAPGSPANCPAHQKGKYAGKAGQIRFDTARRLPLTVQIDNCDVVLLHVTNTGTQLLDISPLYIDPWRQITFIADYPESSYAGLRIPPGQTRTVAYTESLSQAKGIVPTGQGNILLLAVEADESASHAKDFRYLASSNQLPPDRSGASSPLDQLLLSAGFGNGLVRSAPALASKEQAGALIIRFNTTE